MATRAIKRARSRNRAASRGAARNGGETPAAKAKTATESGGKIHQMSGLEWLERKQRIGRRQKLAGELFGKYWRAEAIEGSASMPSCLGLQEVRGGGGGTPQSDYETQAWLAHARAKMAAARQALGFHSGMVAVCEVICGRGWTPREITPIQREADQIENTLRTALDLLAAHFFDPGKIAPIFSGEAP